MPANERQPELIVGLMSGTSTDGIDAAVVEFKSASELSVIATEFTPFDPSLRARINTAALNATLESEQESELHTTLAHCYAQASLSVIKAAGLKNKHISAIANHGQTVRHEPQAAPPWSLQLGDAHLIAQLTGIKTLARFRQADLAAGGQGAPLMPAFHHRVFGANKFILNIGGIANLTDLAKPVIGFDTGPGNTLMDQWNQQHRGSAYDSNGDWARSGKVINKVLEHLLCEPYFSLDAPKSTGTDYFNLAWLKQAITTLDDYAPEDIQATLLALTVASIKDCVVNRTAIHGTDKEQLFVCGGGAQNATLMHQLQLALPNIKIDKTDALGIPSDWVEAVGFAWLGYCRLHNINSNLPSVTGANKELVLGETFNP